MQIKKLNIRGIRQVVSALQRVDGQLAEIAENLALPADVAEMWEGTVPTCFTANLYSAIDAVRIDSIQDAVATLLYAVGQSEESLRHQWCVLQAENRRILQAAREKAPAGGPGDTKETAQ